MVNYLHQLPPNLWPVSSPPTELACGTAIRNWTHLHSKSFHEVNNTLAADAAVRALNYNSTEPIYLVTDASLMDTGAWIGQVPNRTAIIPALFHSRKFKPDQDNHATFDKKLWAIVDGLEPFRFVLSGCMCTILTDYRPQESFCKQYDLIGTQARSQQTHNQFDCTIEYFKEDQNVIEDAFSRVFVNSSMLPSPSDFIPQSIDHTVRGDRQSSDN